MKRIAELSPESRIWIYQANRNLSPEEVISIEEKAVGFIDEWTSHGQNMTASVEIFHNRFLIVAADEEKASASGCGIDKSVRFVQNMGTILGVDFFRRTLILYRKAKSIAESEIHVFWALRKAEVINDETIVFDNTIRKVSDLEKKWEVPFSESWHAEMWRK